MSERNFFERIFGRKNGEKKKDTKNDVEQEALERPTAGSCMDNRAEKISDLLRSFSRGEKIAIVAAGIGGVGVVSDYLIDNHEKIVNQADAYLFEEARVKGIDDLFTQAGNEVRSNEALKREFTSEQIDAIADGLERFDAKRMLEALSARSGLSTKELAARWKVKEVVAFGEDALRQEYVGDDLTRYGVTYNARYDTKNNRVVLNLSEISRDCGGDPEQLTALVLDHLYHENLHAIAPIVNVASNLEMWMREGQTEFMASELYRDVHGVSDPFLGHETSTSAVALLYTQFDEAEQRQVWAAYLKKDRDQMERTIDRAYGVGAYDHLVAPDKSLLATNTNAVALAMQQEGWEYAEQKAQHFAHQYQTGLFLLRALETIDEQHRESGMQTANIMLGHYSIARLHSDRYTGVVVQYDDGKYQKVIGGLLTEKGAPDHHVIFDPSAKPETRLLRVPATNVDVITLSSDAASPDEAMADLNNMLNKLE